MKAYTLAAATGLAVLTASSAFATTVLFEVEDNDTLETANVIASHDGAINIFGAQTESTYSQDPRDFFLFAGTAGDEISIEVRNEGVITGFDSTLFLYGTDGTQLAYNDDDFRNASDVLGSFISTTLGSSGLFGIGIAGFGGSQFNYRVEIRGLTEVSPVPLPAGAVLLMTGLAGLGLSRNLRKPQA